MNSGPSFEFGKDSAPDPLAAMTRDLVDEDHAALLRQAHADVPIDLPPYRYTTEAMRDGRNLTQDEVDMLNAYLDAKREDPSTPMPPDVHAYYFPPDEADRNTFELYSEVEAGDSTRLAPAVESDPAFPLEHNPNELPPGGPIQG